MQFKTSISKIDTDDIIIRDNKLSNLIANYSFTDGIFLLLSGRFPETAESKIFSAMLTSIIDHGMGTTSALTTRFVTSGGNSLNAAVGAGILAQGDFHGGAIETSMKQISQFTTTFKTEEDLEKIIKEYIEYKKTIFGYGHKVYKQGDPRVKMILNICDELGYKSEFVDTALKIESLIEKIKGSRLVLNIDGLIAALLLTMGFKPNIGKGIFIIGRVPGLVAHSIEEKENEKPVRRLEEDQITYNPKNT